MRRTALLVVLVLVSIPAFAINRSRVRAGDRVGVLRSFPGERDPIERSLVRELRARGIDAFDAEVTYEDLVRGDAASAAWYVEVSFAGHEAPACGVGVGAGPVSTTVAVVDSDIAAHMRLLDGRTFEEIDAFDLRRHGRSVQPTGIGLGGRAIWAWLPLAFLTRTGAVDEMARDAAARIAQESR